MSTLLFLIALLPLVVMGVAVVALVTAVGAHLLVVVAPSPASARDRDLPPPSAPDPVAAAGRAGQPGGIHPVDSASSSVATDRSRSSPHCTT